MIWIPSPLLVDPNTELNSSRNPRYCHSHQTKSFWSENVTKYSLYLGYRYTLIIQHKMECKISAIDTTSNDYPRVRSTFVFGYKMDGILWVRQLRKQKWQQLGHRFKGTFPLCLARNTQWILGQTHSFVGNLLVSNNPYRKYDKTNSYPYSKGVGTWPTYRSFKKRQQDKTTTQKQVRFLFARKCTSFNWSRGRENNYRIRDCRDTVVGPPSSVQTVETGP